MRGKVILLFGGKWKGRQKKKMDAIHTQVQDLLFSEGDNRYITTQDMKNFLFSFKIIQQK